MTVNLYKFLKSKGTRFEFCYSDKMPFVVAGSFDAALMDEYVEWLNGIQQHEKVNN